MLAFTVAVSVSARTWCCLSVSTHGQWPHHGSGENLTTPHWIIRRSKKVGGTIYDLIRKLEWNWSWFVITRKMCSSLKLGGVTPPLSQPSLVQPGAVRPGGGGRWESLVTVQPREWSRHSTTLQSSLASETSVHHSQSARQHYYGTPPCDCNYSVITTALSGSSLLSQWNYQSSASK